MTRTLLTIFLFLLIGFAQAQIKVDSLRVSVAIDSVQKILQTDSLKKKKPKTPPQIAFQKSLMLPGAGQVYNRQKWLVPIIYAGAITSGGFIAWFGTRYKIYRDAYINASINKKPVTVQDIKIDKFGITKIEKGPYSASQLAFAKNGYRRYRDLNYIGLALGWTLQAVQANVQAHLGTFDNNNDISLKFKPYFDGYTGGVSLVLGLENTEAQRHKGTKAQRYSIRSAAQFDVGK